MKLTMLTNLGLSDAKRLGLDQEEAQEGDTLDVEAKVGEELLRNGWATEFKPKPEPKKAPAPAPLPANLDAMTVEDLRTFAASRNVPGVGPATLKDDALKAIRKHAAEAKANGNA